MRVLAFQAPRSANVGLGYRLTVLSFYADLCVWSSSSNSPVNARRYTEQSHSTATSGVVVPERGGAPLRRFFFEPEGRSGKYSLSQAER